MISYNKCKGLIRSGKHRGEKCNNRSCENGFCGIHRSQRINKTVEIYFINNSGTNIELYKRNELLVKLYNDGIYKLEMETNYNIENYKIVYTKYDIIQNLFDDNIIQFRDIKQIVISALCILDMEIEMNKKWKSVALKSLKILQEIKKLSTSDTVNELCDLTEYIELPEEISDRDFQLAGATYNPDDEYEYEPNFR